MRKIYLLLVQVLLAVSCTEQTEQPKAADAKMAQWLADSTALRVAVMPTIDCLPLFAAADRGWFDDEQVSISLYEYNAQMDCDTAVASGWVDGLATDLVRAEFLKHKGVALDYVTTTNLSWQLLSAKSARIRQLKQLDDKMMAMTRYSATAMLADLLTDSAKLAAERVFKIQVNDVNVRLNMLENNVMDAMLLPEPQATVARCLDSPVLYDSRKANMRLGVIAFACTAGKDKIKKTQIETFLKVYGRACDSINAHGLKSFQDVIVHHYDVQPWVVDSMPDTLHFDSVCVPRPADIEKARKWLKTKTSES